MNKIKECGLYYPVKEPLNAYDRNAIVARAMDPIVAFLSGFPVSEHEVWVHV